MGNRKPIRTISGEFANPGASWTIEAWNADSRPASPSHTQLSTKAVADIQRLERRDVRKAMAHALFNLPPTFELKILREIDSRVSVIVALPVSLRGNSKHARTHRQLTPAQQLEKIVNFWAFLFYEDEHKTKPYPQNWQYAVPGYTAYFFWANALLSKYCDFWGHA